MGIAPEREKAEALNRTEKSRDPSHVRALSPGDLESIVVESGMTVSGKSSYRLEMELERQLSSSYPDEGDDERIRKMFYEDLLTDFMGIGTQMRGNEIWFSYPVTVVVCRNTFNP